MPLAPLEDTITRVVEATSPSVVSIATVQVARDDFYRPFPVEGIGSGVVLGRDGLVVTNHHVVRRARSAEVHLADGRRIDAEYLGGDREYDLALLRANADDLEPARLGDSDRLKVGQLAIAIGSPFGQLLGGPTVAVGVVSALHRHLRTPQGFIDDLIQADAPINPGNSGGALVSTEGEVFGINTAIIPWAQGIGFAIPSNQVRAVVDQVLSNGRVAHPWLGVSGATLTPALASRLAVKDGPGVMVFDVADDSPAARAGLRAGDVVERIDDRDLPTVEALRTALGRRPVGDRVRLDVRRGPRRSRVEAVLEERSE